MEGATKACSGFQYPVSARGEGGEGEKNTVGSEFSYYYSLGLVREFYFAISIVICVCPLFCLCGFGVVGRIFSLLFFSFLFMDRKEYQLDVWLQHNAAQRPPSE